MNLNKYTTQELEFITSHVEFFEKELEKRYIAEFVSEACMRMAKRIERELIEKACEYLKSLVYQEFAGGPLEQTFSDEDIEDFRKAMEE